jgi:ribosome biogenesis ATPase
MQDVRELIEYPLSHPEIYAHLGVEPPRGILLHGPPGCGKTSLANAIAGELGVAFLRVSAPEIVSGMSGQSEQKVRSLFEEAIAKAPCLVFIDEIDAITPKRETASRGMERRIVAQLLTCLDSLTMENTGGNAVMVIGATNRPDSLDPALRRAGRFDREICMSVPDKNARARILQVLCSKLRLSGAVDIELIARSTPGFVGADLVALTKEAAVIAVNRIFRAMLSDDTKGSFTTASTNVDASSSTNSTNSSTSSATTSTTAPDNVLSTPGGRARSHSLDERTRVSARLKDSGPLTADELSHLSVTMNDFLAAVKKVQPSAKREGFATAPDVTWDDIGALSEVRDDLEFSIMQPIRNPERFEAVGLQVPAGVLLYGPPGCGKTMLAKAIAHESGANFISVKGPELLDKYVGESEKAVRQVFHRAQMSSPCVIFFDELDALCPKRGGQGGGGGGVSERVVNQLLTELDGMETRRNVFVIAATNRPDIIDQAMLRPGRLDKLLYVPLPKPGDRQAILKTLARKSPLGNDVNLDEIAQDGRCNGYSGADVAALLREATVQALKSCPVGEKVLVYQRHFNVALSRITPSVSARDQKRYLRMKNKLSHSRISIGNEDININDTIASSSSSSSESGAQQPSEGK